MYNERYQWTGHIFYWLYTQAHDEKRRFKLWNGDLHYIGFRQSDQNVVVMFIQNYIDYLRNI